MATLISTSADITWAESHPSDRILQEMSNSHLLVVYKDTASGNLYYRTSGDGATWTAALVLPGSPTPAGLCSMQVWGDVVYLWYSGTPGAQLYASAFDPTTNTLGVASTYSYSIAGVTGMTAVDAAYLSGQWAVSAVITKGSQQSIAVFQVPGFDGSLSSTQNFIDLNYPHSGASGLRITLAGNFLHVTWYDTARKTLMLAPISWSISNLSYNTANLETVATFTDAGLTYDIVQEHGGTQSFAIANSSLLYSLVRTAARTYSAPVPLNAQLASGAPALLQDGSNLYVGYETSVNQPAGEAYLLQRSSSTWQLPALLAGGSSAGFSVPILGRSVVHGYMVIYQDASNNLWFLGWTTSGPPNAPTGLAPSGTISTLTPRVSWQSNPSAPNDPTKSHQVRAYRISDSFLVGDSGEVVSGLTYYDVPGGWFAYNTPYGFQVREKDSLSALGAGTWGAWSALCTITPVRAATVIITSVGSGGVTYTVFPATIGGADLQAHVTYTQPDSHPTNGYKMVLYAADDATVLASTTIQTLLPTVATGGSFDTIDWLSGGITNGLVCHLAIQTVDASNAVMSESAHVQLHVVLTPPGPPTGLTAAADNDAGTVTLNWDNSIEAMTTLVEWQPYTESGKPLGWRQLGPSGQLWNQLITTNQAPQLRADYRITCIDGFGIASTPATATGVILGNPYEWSGIWVNDVTDPLNRKAPVGFVDNWDSLKRDRAYDLVEWVPQGSTQPIQLFGITGYWILGTSNALKVFIPATDVDAHGNPIYGADIRDMIISMSDTHATLAYRDRRFPVPIYVKLVAYEDQPDDDVNTTLTIELHSTGYYQAFPVVGSLVLE